MQVSSRGEEYRLPSATRTLVFMKGKPLMSGIYGEKKVINAVYKDKEMI